MFLLNRKGSWDFLYGTFSIIIGAVLLVTFLSITGALDNSFFSGSFGKFVDVTQKIATSLVSGIFKLVAPTGVDENTQYVALGMFLLVWVIGSYSLSNVGFFGPLSAFFVSGIVGMVGSRLLTKELIERSNLVAGPLTAMLIIFAVFPIIMVKGILDRIYKKKESDMFFMSKNDAKKKVAVWKISITRIVVWALLGFIYYFVIGTVLSPDSQSPGAIAWAYGLAPFLFGFFDSWKYMRVHMLTEEEARAAGRGIATAKKTIKEAKALLKGEQEGAEEQL